MHTHACGPYGSVLESTQWQDGGYLASILFHLIPLKLPSTKQTVTLLRDDVIRASRTGSLWAAGSPKLPRPVAVPSLRGPWPGDSAALPGG